MPRLFTGIEVPPEVGLALSLRRTEAAGLGHGPQPVPSAEESTGVEIAAGEPELR